MTVHPGRYELEGRITLRTSRDGLAAQAGHDLTIDFGRWSGGLVIGDDLAPVSLDVRAELGSLVVRAGTGGIKPLSDRDRREILATARKVLSADRYPEATFTATSFSPSGDDGVIDGTLTLAGRAVHCGSRCAEPSPTDIWPRRRCARQVRDQAVLRFPRRAQGFR